RPPVGIAFAGCDRPWLYSALAASNRALEWFDRSPASLPQKYTQHQRDGAGIHRNQCGRRVASIAQHQYDWARRANVILELISVAQWHECAGTSPWSKVYSASLCLSVRHYSS